MRTAVAICTKVLLASFHVSSLIINIPFTIGETLLVAAIKMCGIMRGKIYGQSS